VATSDNFSLGEYLAQAQRSMGGGQFGRVSGPLSGYLFGPDALKKATNTYQTVGATTFTATYGKKVWDALNNKTVTFNAIKKVDWGPTVGWRLRTDRGANSSAADGKRSRPVTETGALPTVDVSAYVGVYSYPKNIVSTFGVSLKSQAVSALEGGIGNQFAVEQEATSRDHIKEINQELMASTGYLCSGGSSTIIVGIGANTYSLVNHFRVGDTLACSANDATTGVITIVDASSGTITTAGNTLTGVNGQSMYIKGRAGLTSIDDIVNNDSWGSGNVACPADVYNLTTRTAGNYAAAALASHNNGVGRDLTLKLVDSCFEKIRQNGGEPKLIVCGLDTYDRFNQLLQAQQRFVDVTDYIVGAGDERTYPGTRAGFQLATYRGVPILPDPDCPKSMDLNDVLLGTNMYVLDTDYLETAVMYPTQYIENRDYFAANALVIRGMFITMAEVRALRFDVHSKITDLNV